MTSVAYLDRAERWARIMEDREAARSGQPIKLARKTVSRRVGVSPGTLENLRKGRLKAIAAHWYDNLRAGVIAELETELRHVEHEIQIARQSGLDPASGEAHALLASEARIREALGLPKPTTMNGEQT
jgi:hypothetical protein